MPYHVHDYQTGERIGLPSVGLREASFAVRDTGAVLACSRLDDYADGCAEWDVCDAPYASTLRREGFTVKTVYVMEN